MSEFEESKCNIINLKTDIKSSYNLVKIFSFLDKKQQMKIITYNNHLKNILGVSIKDYKEVSGRYKIGGKNGKGSEYSLNTNILIFEGEYIKGKKNGKGKEYYDNNGKLKFEGEY